MMLAMKILALAATLAPAAHAQPQNCHEYAPVVNIKGRKFFNAITGKYVPIKGVNYYPRPNVGILTAGNSIDYFTEEHRGIWERDIANFVDLGVNAVRIFSVNPSFNHDAFMCALKAAGIYAIIGLSADCLGCAIDITPAPTCYSASVRWRGEFVINQFSKYENVLAFSVANEPSLEADDYKENLPCVKKFIRDMRAYVSNCNAVTGTRKVPIGIVVVDRHRDRKANYYGCKTNPNDPFERADWFGINVYRHCSKDDTGLSGWHRMRVEANDRWNLTVPAMVTEYGCVGVSAADFDEIDGFESQRDWKQTEALYGDLFRAAFAGGFIFEYSTEKKIAEQVEPTTEWPFTTYGKRNLGLGYFTPEGCDDITVPCEYVKFPEFSTLAEIYKSVDTSAEPDIDDYVFDEMTPEPTCPSQIQGIQDFTWPSDTDYTVFGCPIPVAVWCPGVPQGCTTWAPVPAPPTGEPSAFPIGVPSGAPSAAPIGEPTVMPSSSPSSMPSVSPSSFPSGAPSGAPSSSPSSTPSDSPSSAPSSSPSGAPSSSPTGAPESAPVVEPSGPATIEPVATPSLRPVTDPPLSIAGVQSRETSEAVRTLGSICAIITAVAIALAA